MGWGGGARGWDLEGRDGVGGVGSDRVVWVE